MLFHSTFHPDPERAGEWIACLWQGEGAPPDFALKWYVYLPGEPRGMIFLWQAEAAGRAWFERAIAAYGRAITLEVTDATAGMAFAIDRDLAGIEAWLLDRGMPPDQVARQVDLRRRGIEAADQATAAEAGRAWTREG